MSSNTITTTPLTVSTLTSPDDKIQPTSLTDTIDLVNTTTTSSSTDTSILQPQWVYIQTPPKITMSTPSSNKTGIVVNALTPLAISNVGPNVPNKNNLPVVPSNQGVILAHPVNSNTVKQQHLVIQKPTGVQSVPVMPVSVATNLGPKNTLAYLTMIKASQLSSNPTNQQKYVLAPMPKLTSNRLPATVTTNCVQSKIAFMPLPVPNAVGKNNATNKQKVFNVKITDGQMQLENNDVITVMCENTTKTVNNEVEDVVEIDDNESVVDKSYELSIVENSAAKNDVSFTITLPNESYPSTTCSDKTKLQNYTKYPKHGVSILKKNCNLESVTKVAEKSGGGGLIISPIPNSITTISDFNTKEVKITTNSNYNNNSGDSPLVITEHNSPSLPIPPPPQKPERRRKSQFSYRKDYNEVVAPTGDTKKPNGDLLDDDIMEIKVIKEKSDMYDNFDAKKVLKWENGVGTLPGSEIKFQINEFGLLEYLNKDDYKHNSSNNKSVSPKPPPLKEVNNKSKDYFQEEMRCLECGCYGMPSEFISPKYCSYDCQEAGMKATRIRELKLKRKTKTWLKRNSDTKSEKDEFPSEEDATSNENSQDKFNYPWTCAKKGFSWPKYLEHVKAKAAPVKFFKDPFPYNRNGFRPGMKLEGIDPQHPSYFCVLTVVEVLGYRMRLHFDGYSENYDFWVNADSMDIFPAGWCEKYGHVLHPPPKYTVQDFNWAAYLKQTKGSVAPKHLFANRAGSAICPNGFRVGMKLEAVDRKNTSLICVATITDMMDNRVLVHFDSWNEIYDYWADPTSPYIHPVGWADQNGHNLTPPNDYPNPDVFTWEKYLKETKSVAAPVRAFKQRPAYAFKKGMRLECVDKRIPRLIRVATVDDVQESQIRIGFDGWPDRYSYWVDNDSNDIHPAGWCQKTGHPIEPPLTPDDVYDFLECPTVGCRGLGHKKGPKFSVHTSPKDCPYSDENLNKENKLSDRLLHPNQQLEAAVPVSREPKEKQKSKTVKPAKIPKKEPPSKIEWFDDELDSEDTKPLKHKSPKIFKVNNSIKKESIPLTNGYSNSHVEQIWEKHSKYLRPFVRGNADPRLWRIDDVVQFVTSVPYCRNHGALFREHKIDGEAFLMLSQQDLVDILKIKVGPAIKLYSIIVLLRRKTLS